MKFKGDMRESETLKGVFLFSQTSFQDERGEIWTSYHKEQLNEFTGLTLSFCHDKFVRSRKNALRGIHGDPKTWKLVSAVSGEIFQVVVDARPGSDTYLQYDAFTLRGENLQSLLIPPGFGNAFLTLTESSMYHYKLAYAGAYNDHHEQFTLKWNDPRIGIQWPIEFPILSERDNDK